MSEYSPPGSHPRMSKAQMRKWLEDTEAARKIAEAKLDPEKEQIEQAKSLLETEEKLDDIFLS